MPKWGPSVIPSARAPILTTTHFCQFSGVKIRDCSGISEGIDDIIVVFTWANGGEFTVTFVGVLFVAK